MVARDELFRLSFYRASKQGFHTKTLAFFEASFEMYCVFCSHAELLRCGHWYSTDMVGCGYCGTLFFILRSFYHSRQVGGRETIGRWRVSISVC